MALEKALIKPETPSGAPPIPVLFNPTRYGLESSNQFSEQAVVGLGSPILQYVRGNARSLSMELFFDTYEQASDVRQHTDRIYGLLGIERSTHVPPVCTFTWGQFSLRCVVERVSGSFTLFLDDGTPVRATLTVSFKEFVDPDTAIRETNRESADHTKTYPVRRGDTLSGIAAAEYGDPGQWRPIAVANGITNPRVLEAGRLLVIPPLSGRERPA
ncbi:MAG TPA: LysM peptidoglycan-binding domain-containing protein [Gaiellaceae bacterium]|jgi:LysM repeat protein